jgi:hypothetical protein
VEQLLDEVVVVALGAVRSVPRFRPTFWPGTVIKPPSLLPVAHVEVRGDWLVWTPFDGRQVERVELPSDFYLRELLELSPSNLNDTAEVIRKYGAIL